MSHGRFSEECYVADGRVKEVDAQVCPGLAVPLGYREQYLFGQAK